MSETTVLNVASLATLIAFPLLYIGVHNNTTPLLVVGMLLVGVSMALPLLTTWLTKN